MRYLLIFILRLIYFPIKVLIWRKWRILLKSFGHKSQLVSPLSLDGKKNISIGNQVYVGYKTWLAALPLTGEKSCLLELQDGVTIGHFNHIYATKKIILEKDVLTADRVYISDNLHGYSDIHVPIKKTTYHSTWRSGDRRRFMVGGECLCAGSKNRKALRDRCQQCSDQRYPGLQRGCGCSGKDYQTLRLYY